MYEKLSNVKFLAKSYTFKFLFIAFLGIHIPLIGLVLFVLFRPQSVNTFTILMLTLLLTLGATAITLYIMNGLLMPLRKSRQALQLYMNSRQLPNLPVQFTDEAGMLMGNIQFTLTELNDLLEEKRDLTALLSHDLRIPLRNVKTFSKYLLGEKDPEAVSEIAQMILDSADEQSKLLEEVLSILRQEHLFYNAGQNVKVSASEVLEDAFASFTSIAAEKNISLQKNILFTGTFEVQPELFKQVVKNLLSNAIKFSYPYTQVNVSVYKKNTKVFIDIADSGMGFEPQQAERLFDRFTKSGRKGTNGEPTTGIGLYLSRKIIKHHKGTLTAASNGAGTGATFSICLN